MAKRFVVMGAGAWGTALAAHLARAQQDVTLWGHDSSHIEQLKASGVNQAFLPGVKLPKALAFSASLETTLATKAIVLLVVPSHAFKETLQKLKPFANNVEGLLWGTKGLSDDGRFLHELCQEVFPQHPVGILAGPSFAKEVAQGLPTAVTVASNQVEFAKTCANAFHFDLFRVYVSDELVGAELGGVVKNVLAIAVGMADGLGYGANARAALITRGLAECGPLAKALKVSSKTLLSMACLGDIVLTCTDNQSRNRRFGLLLGEGKSASDAETIIQHVVEGKKNVAQLMQLAQKHQVELPICTQVYQVLYDHLQPEQALHNLLSRAPKREDT